ncbi:MAG: DUF1553 domain-containing protein, partial [Verrucomicrobiota bacterium]|nr:DUF1553 domain-containing protein [Verrucomicrobiota bacterium]
MNSSFHLPFGIATLTGAAWLVITTGAPAAPVDFGREVLPILSDACFACHGPDEKARKADLRLDTKEGAFRTQDGITVIKPGDLELSELVLRITSHDKDEVMPPPKAPRTLKAEEIALLKRWVAEGAGWGKHWAFEPMQTPAPPETGRAEWARNEIDRFVLARLEQEKLAPSPEAGKERLIRRVTLDLTGLAPTPAETDAFLADSSSGAFATLLDRLLASPRFGERMASEWLDLARYADTHGYQMDRPRAMWAWRDWVIKAFNENMPYERFVTWQLAGDLLPGATKEQRLATAFNRLHNQNEEGGIVEEEYRVAYVVDRVNTFGTAFLGLTMECTRCHDHKFDPLTQRDFYSLFSFFQNIDESGQITYAGFADAMPVPTLLLSTDEQDRQLQELQRKTADQERQLARSREEARPAFVEWLGKKGEPPAQAPGLLAEFSFDALDGGKVANAADPSKPGKIHEDPKLVPGHDGKAAELDGENGFTFPRAGHFKRSDAFSLSLWLQPPAPTPRATIVHHSKAPIDAGSRGYELLLEEGRVAFALHYMWPGASLKVATKQPVPANEWTHVLATYDGSSRAAGARVYVNGAPAELEVVRDGLFKDITYDKGEPDLAIGYRFRDNGFKGGRVDDFRIFGRALTPLEAAHVCGRPDLADAWNAAPGQLTPAQREGLFEYFIANIHPLTRAAATQLQALREEQSRLVSSIPEAMVMQELPRPKPAFILQRGAYDARGEPVTAETPPALPPFPPDAPRNRLGLARWLLEPEHPLMARVTVNRLWQMMFGRGLVETSDNFGIQGATPTHPELLDWLARDFVSGGWDVKQLLKKIAFSATYRQSSKAAPELLARDPQNLLLARGPARQLTAEMLRDQALAASGLLVEKLGGPSVKPYQPPGLWEEIAMGKPRYEQGRGEDLHRRSLYTFWKRTVPPPAMTTFDAADRSYCTVRRQSTSTPLQALALLNDVQIVEAARLIAQRMLKEGGATLDAQLA